MAITYCHRVTYMYASSLYNTLFYNTVSNFRHKKFGLSATTADKLGCTPLDSATQESLHIIADTLLLQTIENILISGVNFIYLNGSLIYTQYIIVSSQVMYL